MIFWGLAWEGVLTDGAQTKPSLSGVVAGGMTVFCCKNIPTSKKLGVQVNLAMSESYIKAMCYGG